MSTRERPPTRPPRRSPSAANGEDPARHSDATDPATAAADPSCDTLHLSTTAERTQLSAIRQTACAFADQHDVARPVDVALAVGEALANVVLHAYRDGPAGPLIVLGFVDDELVHVTVADEGTGLRPRGDSPGLGLGLSIIARASDHFQISDHEPAGTQISMGFARTTPTAGPDAELEQVRAQLSTAIEDGCGLDSVQAQLDQTALSADARDALWLYAWSTIELHRRHDERSR